MGASCHPCLRINEDTIQYNTVLDKRWYNMLTKKQERRELIARVYVKNLVSSERAYHARRFRRTCHPLTSHMNSVLPGLPMSSGFRSLSLTDFQSFFLKAVNI